MCALHAGPPAAPQRHGFAVTLALFAAILALMESPEFVGRLSPEPGLARRAAFALFTLAYLTGTGTLDAVPVPDALPQVVAGLGRENPHLFAAFDRPARREALAGIDAGAARDLVGWARAQRLDREPAQIAYELGVLALGVTLPPVLVRSLRLLDLTPGTMVAELPDAAGYPTVFLSTLHPHWPAATNARLLVYGEDARQLAAWALLLLTRRLAPPPGAIMHLPEAPEVPLTAGGGAAFDVAVSYNPVAWAAPEHAPDVLTAGRLVVV